MTYDEREAEFLKELTALTKKYKIEIWGCGCCGSPGLSSFEDSPVRGEGASAIEEYAYTHEGHLEFNKVQT